VTGDNAIAVHDVGRKAFANSIAPPTIDTSKVPKDEKTIATVNVTIAGGEPCRLAKKV